jgi:hypothetical protein
VVFSLGVFSCISSIVRLHSIRIYTESSDPFYDSVPINLWSMVEVNIGIWCASMPALKALIAPRPRDGTEEARKRVYQYHSKDKSGTAGRGTGASSSDRSQGVSIGLESFDLVMDDTGKVVKAAKGDGEVQSPQRSEAGRKQINVHNEWTVLSEERGYSPDTGGRA